MTRLLLVFLLCLQGCVVADKEPLLANAERGERVFNDRDKGHCLLCHQLSSSSEPFQGNLGPSLDGLASRYNALELKARITDPRRYNPNTIMPAYYSIKGLSQVAEAYQGKTILTEQEIDDLVTYLLRQTSL